MTQCRRGGDWVYSSLGFCVWHCSLFLCVCVVFSWLVGWLVGWLGELSMMEGRTSLIWSIHELSAIVSSHLPVDVPHNCHSFLSKGEGKRG
ncbi:hypothetical protein K457DRAFT_300938 [Linnemannia elongata AG-77]|uniref:Uncharacterized protein n=1 Tax=Linnemannia elongata AG-77 TaxID=1314771 RepID=A0A197K529_9FUNG|nr:hypothetical protein K457DRAFT_300938 [Linnemannia elongata AG-77]